MMGMVDRTLNEQADYYALAVSLRAQSGYVGTRPPYYAETASVKGDCDWPFWIVRNRECNSLGWLLSREHAERTAQLLEAV